MLVYEATSQQAPVTRVTPSWHEWMKCWPESVGLAAASPAEVILARGNLGHLRHALRLQGHAAVVAVDWSGVLFSSRDGLLTLSGIGPYAAGVVIVSSYRRRFVVLDTSTRRVLCRLYGTAAPPFHLCKGEIVQADVTVSLEDDLAWQWNIALMELDTLVYTAKNPACQECPLRPDCAWSAADRLESDTPHRVQRFTGTHRGTRGEIMTVLRGARSPVSRDGLIAAASLAPSRFDPTLDSLFDGGPVCLHSGGYVLPRKLWPARISASRDEAHPTLKPRTGCLASRKARLLYRNRRPARFRIESGSAPNRTQDPAAPESEANQVQD